jgi:restriction endonuclease Mrr
MPEYISRNGEWEVVRVKTDKMSTVVDVKPVFEVSMEATETIAQYDINQDGVVDEKDASLAAKVLNNAKKRKPRKKK